MAFTLRFCVDSFDTVQRLIHLQFYNYGLLAEQDITSIYLIWFAYGGQVDFFIILFKSHLLFVLIAM